MSKKVFMVYNSNYELPKKITGYKLLKVGNTLDNQCHYYLNFIEYSKPLKSIIKVAIAICIVLMHFRHKFIISGAQDRLTIFILQVIIALRREYTVIPANFEHFRRPEVLDQKVFNLCANASFKDGRYFYRLPKNTKIDEAEAPWCRNVELKGYKPIFVSQPYYIDHGISEDTWIPRLLSVLDFHNIEAIKFHPRDTLSFKKTILNHGITEVDYVSNNLFGVMSQLLVQARNSGSKVTLVFTEFEDLFSEEYRNFVQRLICRFQL